MKEGNFRPEQQEIEKFEEILTVKVMRHGPKETAEGEKDDLADYFEDSLIRGWQEADVDDDAKGLVHINASNIRRAQDSARVINRQLNHTEHRTRKNTDFVASSKLATVFKDGDIKILTKLQAELKNKYQSELDKGGLNLSEEQIEAELRNRIDTEFLTRWIDDNDLLEISPDDLSDGLAIRYAGFARHLGSLKDNKHQGVQPEDEPYLQIDVTHSFPTMLFLKKYLIFDDGQRAGNMNPEDFFERTDGIIPESGNFEMSYNIDDDGKVEILVTGKFKDKEFSGTLDIDMLDELYKEGKKEINAE